MCGIRKDIQKVDEFGNYIEYTTPKFKKCKDLDDFIIDKTIRDIKPYKNADDIMKKIKDKTKNHVIACSGFGNYMTNMTPTLTCNTYYYLTKYKRFINSKESLLLQGFPKNFIQVVSERQMYKQAGNSRSVCVLKALFKEIFKICNL